VRPAPSVRAELERRNGTRWPVSLLRAGAGGAAGREEFDGYHRVENNQERIDAGRFWMLFLAQLVFMGWLLALVHFQVKIVQSNGNNVVGPSDFSVWISGIKPSSSADVYLRKWCQQWGPIMAAFNVPSVGEGIRIGRQVEDILVRKEEADADPGHKSWNPILWIFRRFVVGKPAGLDEKLEDSRIKLKIHEKQETSPTGYALATFRYTDAAAECINTFDTSPLGRACELLTCGLTSTKPLLHGSAVEVCRAPEPSDMIWEHTQCGSYEVWRRRIISWAVTICVIMAGAGIQYGLAAGAERLREERYIADITAGNGDESSERDASIKTTRIRVVTMLTGIMVVIINFSTMLTVRFLSWYERWTTRSVHGAVGTAKAVLLAVDQRVCRAAGCRLRHRQQVGLVRARWPHGGGIFRAVLQRVTAAISPPAGNRGQVQAVPACAAREDAEDARTGCWRRRFFPWRSSTRPA
jgi:hypothetical protein